jgi:PAS domain S-box-containing protein
VAPATHSIPNVLSRRTVLVAGIALIVVVGAATALIIWLLRAQALERAELHLDDLAGAVAEHAHQSIHSVGLIVSATAEEAAPYLERGAEFAERAVHQRLRDRVKALPHVLALTVIDRDGDLLAHSDRFPAPAVNYADREYFRAHREGEATGLHIGEPVMGRTTGIRTYTFSQRVSDPMGRFRGAVVAAARLEYFQEFYRRLKLGPDGRVFVFRADGVLLTSYPVVENAVGRRFADDPLFAQSLATPGAGVVRRAGFVDAKPRVIAYRKLADEPVVVAVSSTQDFVLTAWRHEAFQLAAVGAATAAFLLLAMLLVLRQMRERAALQGELTEAGEKLHRIVDAAMDAIITIDEKQRIVMFNVAAEKIFRMPASEALGQPLDRFIPERFRTAHRRHVWRFGETRESMRMMGEHLVLYGLRADGEEFPIDASISQIDHEGGKLFTVILRDITVRKQAEAALERSYVELRELSAAMNEVREGERTRIARELHDELAQWLTALKMDVAWLSSRLPDEQRQLIDRTERMKGLLDTMVGAVRRIAAALRPVMLDDLGLVAATENLLHDFSQRTGIVVSHEVEGWADDLGEPLSTSLYRILQEAVTNVARHAQASEVGVTLRRENGDLVLRVHDNGRGFDAQVAVHGKSFGVLGMRERAHTLGGRARIERLATGGTVVEIVIPYERYETGGEGAGHDSRAAG